MTTGTNFPTVIGKSWREKRRASGGRPPRHSKHDALFETSRCERDPEWVHRGDRVAKGEYTRPSRFRPPTAPWARAFKHAAKSRGGSGILRTAITARDSAGQLFPQ